jgi:hypothetical protein
MEEINNKYIEKLVNGNSVNTGSFLATNNEGIIYFANKYFKNENSNHFIDLLQNISKFAVIIDEDGTGNWIGTTFRNINFISNTEDKCIKYIELKSLEEKMNYDRMDLVEKLLELIQNSSNTPSFASQENEINSKISEIERILIEVNNQLIQLQD